MFLDLGLSQCKARYSEYLIENGGFEKKKKLGYNDFSLIFVSIILICIIAPDWLNKGQVCRKCVQGYEQEQKQPLIFSILVHLSVFVFIQLVALYSEYAK